MRNAQVAGLHRAVPSTSLDKPYSVLARHTITRKPRLVNKTSRGSFDRQKSPQSLFPQAQMKSESFETEPYPAGALGSNIQEPPPKPQVIWGTKRSVLS